MHLLSLSCLSSQNYTPPNAQESEYQSIPLNKIEDFGVHSSRYYPLEISHFKSSMDAQLLESLWNKYWVMTLSQSPLISVSRGDFWRRSAHTAAKMADVAILSILATVEPSLHDLADL